MRKDKSESAAVPLLGTFSGFLTGRRRFALPSGEHGSGSRAVFPAETVVALAGLWDFVASRVEEVPPSEPTGPSFFQYGHSVDSQRLNSADRRPGSRGTLHGAQRRVLTRLLGAWPRPPVLSGDLLMETPRMVRGLAAWPAAFVELLPPGSTSPGHICPTSQRRSNGPGSHRAHSWGVWSVATETDLKDAVPLANQMKKEEKKKFLIPCVVSWEKKSVRGGLADSRGGVKQRAWHAGLSSNPRVPACHPWAAPHETRRGHQTCTPRAPSAYQTSLCSLLHTRTSESRSLPLGSDTVGRQLH